MEETNLVKSILKKPVDNSEIKKRLSFASANKVAQYDESLPQYDRSVIEANPGKPISSANPFQPDTTNSSIIPLEDQTQLGDYVIVIPMCQSLRNTTAGLCYVPPKRASLHYRESLPLIPMKENTRNIYQTAIESISSTTANVLIIGNKVDGEKIKKNILSLHETQKIIGKLSWSFQLNIMIEEFPSPDVFIGKHYFIFLAYLSVMECISMLSEQLANLRNSGSLPSLCAVVLCFPTLRDVNRNFTTHEKMNAFLDENQLCCILWNKPDKDHYLRLLLSIHESVGYHLGVSLLTKSVLKWSAKSPEEAV